ncbi:MAG: TIGR03619 family F420-dependent LLM class oxidoreductase [Actinobacteria bacterium]|nr:TIGR03619 family F420-dependent LLM class oxidoreductase [Actinomycetota bacterium]
MKIRYGLGLGIQQLLAGPESFAEAVDACEAVDLDSLWLSERVAGPTVDPLSGLAFAAGRTTRLKLGTSVLVVPGRNPVLLAKELATIDALSGGRLLPGIGLGTVDPAEHAAFGVSRGDRSAWFDEAVPLMRRLWTEPSVTHKGARFAVNDLRLFPKPVGPMPLWTGGRTRWEYERTGRLADGWLGSFQTVVEADSARSAIAECARNMGRSIDDDHYGMLLIYARDEVPNRIRDLVHTQRPGTSIADLVPSGSAELRGLLKQYVEVGITKFVLVPSTTPDSWLDEMTWLVDACA